LAHNKLFAGFYFFFTYNARLAAAKAALVHRFLTYLSRVSNRACLKTPQDSLRVFRLATMFYAPVTSSPFNGLYYRLRSRKGTFKFVMPDFNSASGYV